MEKFRTCNLNYWRKKLFLKLLARTHPSRNRVSAKQPQVLLNLIICILAQPLALAVCWGGTGAGTGAGTGCSLGWQWGNWSGWLAGFEWRFYRLLWFGRWRRGTASRGAASGVWVGAGTGTGAGTNLGWATRMSRGPRLGASTRSRAGTGTGTRTRTRGAVRTRTASWPEKKRRSPLTAFSLTSVHLHVNA